LSSGAGATQGTLITLRGNHRLHVGGADPVSAFQVVMAPASMEPEFGFAPAFVMAWLAVFTSAIATTAVAREIVQRLRFTAVGAAFATLSHLTTALRIH
jgi:hypothetical protein